MRIIDSVIAIIHEWPGGAARTNDLRVLATFYDLQLSNEINTYIGCPS